MKMVESLLTKNRCMTTSKRVMVIKGLMLHSVGCSQPDAKTFVKNWNNNSVSKCVHAFIDANDGTVYHTLPWNYRGWHAGGSGNNYLIGCEMCEPDCITYIKNATFTCSNLERAQKMTTTTYNSAVELYAYLCQQYKLDPLTQIWSHNEGGKQGFASGHVDPEHLWTQLNMPYTMNGFRHDVSVAMGKTIDTSGEKLPKKVRVRVDDLNIRTGPSTSYKKTGKYTGAGVVTIVEIQNGIGSKKGWGLLKSYAAKRDGWIALDYAEDA